MATDIGYDKITIDAAGIQIDGVRLDGNKLGDGATVEHYGDLKAATITVWAKAVELGDGMPQSVRLVDNDHH